MSETEQIFIYLSSLLITVAVFAIILKVNLSRNKKELDKIAMTPLNEDE